ncbi:hypothetical protein EHS13_19510 [Paenibacillus psychroresistens]|uniref:Uncharacterized protein n=1 Tax=Paenibacillus psychroresistens TaxID=1778678 RepID=A0A6B8RNG0_9BACL|nr:hypothetical protein [Paenibacillus psychroresistens]QGQ96916.1 hypothetical protein EHS13_19510 [Paenibacillus psychroresistens]
MNKRLSRSDYIFSVIIIFMLLGVVGAFFYGIQLGTERVEAKQQELLDKDIEKAKGETSYNQSYLVSFYHTIYLPFKEFQTVWFKDMNDIEIRGNTLDPAALIKELSKLASAKYDTVVTQSMPSTSPLLQDAHKNYLKSLKLFSEAAKSFQTKANSMQVNVLASEIDKDAYFIEAKSFALQAQKQFYDSIVLWNETVEVNALKGALFVGHDPLPLTEWNQMNFNIKNQYITAIMLKNKYFKPYNPQDLLIGIDDMIKSGQAKKMNVSTVQELTDILVGTGAVRQDDFIQGKMKWYGAEKIPQLPFFFSTN